MKQLTRDELEQRVQEQQTAINALMEGQATLGLAYLAKRVSDLEQTRDEHGGRIGWLETNSDAGKVAEVLDSLAKARREFAALQDRVARVESK